MWFRRVLVRSGNGSRCDSWGHWRDCCDRTMGVDVSGIKKSESAFVQINGRLAGRAESGVGRAKNRRIFIENYRNRNIFQNWAERPFIGEGRAEGAFLQERQNLHRDSAGEIDAAVSENPQREIAGFGAESIGPEIESFDACGARASESVLRDFLSGFAGCAFERGVTNIGSEKFVDRAETAPGKKLFAGNAREALFEKSEKGNFAVRTRREIGRAAFRGRGAMAMAVPVEDRFTQASAGGNNGDVVFRMIHTAIEI